MSLGGLAFVLSPNNVVKEVSTDTKGTFQYVSQYAYVYRPDGYPSQVTITRPGDQPFTLRFVYDR